jgi:splicing factor 3B subunit 1
LLSKLGLVLFEQFREEYPDTLGSITAAEGAIANVVGLMQMNPPVKGLCEYLTKFQRIVWFSNIIYTSSLNDSHST